MHQSESTAWPFFVGTRVRFKTKHGPLAGKTGTITMKMFDVDAGKVLVDDKIVCGEPFETFVYGYEVEPI